MKTIRRCKDCGYEPFMLKDCPSIKKFCIRCGGLLEVIDRDIEFVPGRKE